MLQITEHPIQSFSQLMLQITEHLYILFSVDVANYGTPIHSFSQLLLQITEHPIESFSQLMLQITEHLYILFLS